MAVKSIRQLIIQELNNVRIAIIGSQTSLGLRDSGVSANSFEIRATNNGGELTGAEYIQTNYKAIGIKPNSGTGGGFIQGLLNWGKLEVQGNETRLQAAFRTGRVIREKGSLIYRGKTGIDIDLITENSADRFEEAIADNEEQRAIDGLNSVIP